MKKEKDLDVAILGIKLGIIAIIIYLCVKVVSMFFPISPFFVGVVYLFIASVLFYFLLKIKG